MRRIGTSLTTLAFLVLFAGFGSADVAAAKRVALVIGNNAYSSLPVLQKAGMTPRLSPAPWRESGSRSFSERI